MLPSHFVSTCQASLYMLPGLSWAPFLLLHEGSWVNSYLVTLYTGANWSCRAVRPTRWDSISRRKWSSLHLRRRLCSATLTTIHVCVCAWRLRMLPGNGIHDSTMTQQLLSWQPIWGQRRSLRQGGEKGVEAVSTPGFPQWVSFTLTHVGGVWPVSRLSICSQYVYIY